MRHASSADPMNTTQVVRVRAIMAILPSRAMLERRARGGHHPIVVA